MRGADCNRLKVRPGRDDQAGVAPFSTEVWLVMGVVGALCLLTFLYALSTLYRDQTMVHDLKVRVHDLRRDYAERMAKQHAEQLAAEAIGARSTAPSQPPPALPGSPGPTSPIGAVHPAPARAAA